MWETCAPVIATLSERTPVYENLSERDRRIAEKLDGHKADIKIALGLQDQGKSLEEIAALMKVAVPRAEWLTTRYTRRQR